MADEIDAEEVKAIREELKKLHRRVFLLIWPNRPSAKVGKPIQQATKKISEALTLLGEPEE